MPSTSLRVPFNLRYFQASNFSTTLMDHPCHKCGHSIEDGKPFCPQCGAPQIRVAQGELAPAPVGSSSSADLPAFPLRTPHDVPSTFRAPAISAGIEWRRAFWFCAVAAVASLTVMSLRLIGPFLAMPGAGVLAVILYYRRGPIPIDSARSGAKIGAVTGLISSGVSGFFFAIFVAVLQSGGEVRSQMMEALQQFAAKSSDPQVQTTLDLLKTPQGLNRLVFGMIGVFLISIAAGSVAGALTGAFLGRRKRS